MQDSVKTVKVMVSGRVQGVWFRAWTCEQAESRGLNGWVRNRQDGGVEAVLSGPDKEVNAMLDSLWQGPPAAKVTSMQSEDLDYPPESGFSQRTTA
jgi:acylphosphatase